MQQTTAEVLPFQELKQCPYLHKLETTKERPALRPYKSRSNLHNICPFLRISFWYYSLT